MSTPRSLSPQELIDQLQKLVNEYPNAQLLVDAPTYGEECYALYPICDAYYEPTLGFFDTGWEVETYDNIEEFKELYPTDRLPEFNEYIVVRAME